MTETMDARGLSCPQPVLMLMNILKKIDKGEIEVLVDTEASKENVSRAAESKGWKIRTVQNENSDYRIILTKN